MNTPLKSEAPPPLGTGTSAPSRAPGRTFEFALSSLGADLRDQLNNQLQEIVAMLFVARHAAGAAEMHEQALDAIDHAARKMAKVVASLEATIGDAVRPALPKPPRRVKSSLAPNQLPLFEKTSQ